MVTRSQTTLSDLKDIRYEKILRLRLTEMEQAVDNLKNFLERRPQSLVSGSSGEVIHYRFEDSVTIPRPKELTKARLKSLHLLASNDVTIEELAQRMHRSPVTVHQHIAMAKKALNKKTNIGAILECIRRNYFSLDSLNK